MKSSRIISSQGRWSQVAPCQFGAYQIGFRRTGSNQGIWSQHVLRGAPLVVEYSYFTRNRSLLGIAASKTIIINHFALILLKALEMHIEIEDVVVVNCICEAYIVSILCLDNQAPRFQIEHLEVLDLTNQVVPIGTSKTRTKMAFLLLSFWPTLELERTVSANVYVNVYVILPYVLPTHREVTSLPFVQHSL